MVCGGLTMAPRRSSRCGACIPELTTRRHRGRLLCLGSRGKASTLRGRHRRFAGGSVFHTSFRGVLSLLATQQKKWHHHHYLQQQAVCCVFFPFILDIKFVGRTSRGHTGGRSHRIFNPPSFCGACLDFCREKDSAIPFPRRP